MYIIHMCIPYRVKNVGKEETPNQILWALAGYMRLNTIVSFKIFNKFSHNGYKYF